MRFAARLLRNLVAVLWAPVFAVRWLVGRRRRWVRLRLRSRLIVLDPATPRWRRWLPLPGRGETTAITRLLTLEDEVVRDARVEGVLVEIPRLAAGWAAVSDARDSLARMRAAGKRLVAHLPEGAGHRELHLATACDRILVGRHALVEVAGLASVRRYARPLLERLGVSVEVHRRAEYKTAVEGLSESVMSAPQREQTQAVLDAMEAEILRALAERPGWDEERARAAIQRGVFSAEEAVEAGLVDAVVHDDEVAGLLAPTSSQPSVERAEAYVARRRARLFVPIVQAPRLAIVPVHGAIGDSASPGFVGRDGVVRLLRRLARNRSVRAIVLHVDSPGGSALASERIHREVERLAALKPVVACFGDVAASGGYYVAAAASCIVARGTSLTGSIGVVGARFVASALLERLGLRTEVVKNAPSADLAANPREASAEEFARAEAVIEGYYRRFLEVVATGRKMSVDAVRERARGRVWSAVDARAQGLVDRLGGLREAIEEAEMRAGQGRLERVILWPRAGDVEEPPVALTPRAVLEAVADAIDSDLAQLLRLVGEGEVSILAYAHELPRLR